ncbi:MULTISPECIES: GLPGLI family protein [unclassified Flavobacterium]|uniref:GLPGLI family protein n=1 Tax=unclassified Flavobacterium TaxID=196869 RepID=UPI001F14922A|nr:MULTISPECIES: GLPGLI family protein [unclassified Flavobacterium]UMY65902.1 GLPGLI family protein [Flavobacterium sp. HJ-32-4]
MKHLHYFMALFLVSASAVAQKDFQGMAVYESKTSTADFNSAMGGNREITPEMRKMIEDRMKAMFEKTFILNFDRSASIYKEEEKLDTPGGDGMGGGRRMMMSFMGGGGTYYKNVKEKRYVVDKEFMGKEFLVKDSLPKLEWKLEGETRQIGGYTCYKATAVRPASPADFRNFRFKGKPEEKKEEKDEKKSTNFTDQFEMQKEITITAWYTPDIPINQGPGDYWGLPGLILEVSDGKTVILCSKVVLNVKEKADIKEPSSGKVVSQKEYDDIVVKKMEELKEQGMGPGGNNRMQIRMGR